MAWKWIWYNQNNESRTKVSLVRLRRKSPQDLDGATSYGMKKLLIFTTLLVFTPLFVFAHGNGYLEFNPDNSIPLKVNDVEVPAQIFFAQNDFIGGFDFWVANPAAEGIATFTLLNSQGLTISTKTVNIPTIAETTNGTKLHVDLSFQPPVISNSKYSIRVTSSMPELRLYYSDRIKLVSHSAPLASEYITGVGKLGVEEQPFSFKYALHETTESSVPTISDIIWTVISTNEMKVNFYVNEPVDYRIEYGVDGQGYTNNTNFTSNYKPCVPGVLSCSININVSANTAYQYRLIVKDFWGNQAQATGTFVSGEGQTPTLPLASTPVTTPSVTSSPTTSPELIPPIISNLRIVNVTNNSVDVAWTTNEAANSYLVISFTSDLLTIAAASDPTFELEHLLKIGSLLNPRTPYLARIISRDSSDNPSMASISFTTLSTGSTPSSSVPPSLPSQTQIQTPLPTNIIVTFSGGGADGGIVRWNASTNGEPSDGYRVDVFDKNGKLVKTILVKDGSRRANIPGLQRGDRGIVYANDNGVFEKLDKPASLKVNVEDSFWQRLLSLWPYLLIPIVLGGILVWLQHRKIKNANIKMENYNPKS